PPMVGSILAAVLIFALLFAQLPRSRAMTDNRGQQESLACIERMDARCREHRLAAIRAREVLPPFWLYEPYVNGWEFLRGSASPPPPPDDLEVLRALTEPGE